MIVRPCIDVLGISVNVICEGVSICEVFSELSSSSTTGDLGLGGGGGAEEEKCNGLSGSWSEFAAVVVIRKDDLCKNGDDKPLPK